MLEPAQSGGTVVETLKALDVYPKTLDDFKERTGSGAAVSIISVCSILLLIFSELRAYMTPVTTDHLYVDTTRGERIRINANITFPNMPCAGLKCAGASPLLQHVDLGLPGLKRPACLPLHWPDSRACLVHRRATAITDCASCVAAWSRWMSPESSRSTWWPTWLRRGSR